MLFIVLRLDLRTLFPCSFPFSSHRRIALWVHTHARIYRWRRNQTLACASTFRAGEDEYVALNQLVEFVFALGAAEVKENEFTHKD